jgi:hypothetical protein
MTTTARGLRRAAGGAELLEPRRLLAAVSGSFFWDTRADGSADGGGLIGATVYADLNYNGRRDTTEPSAATGQTGWQLTLGPGEYLLRADAPPGYHLSYPAEQVRWVTVPAASNVTGVRFGAWSTGPHGFAFFNDRNNNGVQDAGDAAPPPTGAWADQDNDGVMDSGEPTFASSKNGIVTIRLRPGTHRLRLAKPSGWSVTPASGYADRTFIASRNSASHVPAPVRGAGIYEIFAYNDLDGDSHYDAANGEAGRAGVTLFIDADDDNVADPTERSARTDASGLARLVGLAVGDRITLLDGATGRLVGEGLADQSHAQGLVETWLPFHPDARLIGSVFSDINRSGVRDPNEPYLAGIRVWADLDGDAALDAAEPSTFTGANGYYRLNGPRGTYRVRAVPTDGYIPGSTGGATAPVQSPGSGDAYLADLSLFDSHRGRLESRVLIGVLFRDDNGNGHRDSGEAGIPGRTVYRDRDVDGEFDPTEPQTVTDSAGFYAFQDVGPGTFELRELLPEGWEAVWVNDRDSTVAQVPPGNGGITTNIPSRQVPPLGVASAVLEPTAGGRVRLRFNRDVSTTLGTGDVVVQNAATGAYLPPRSWHVEQAVEQGVTVATVRFQPAVPDGNYRLILRRGAVADAAGKPLPVDFSFDLFVLAGDVNRDRAVNGADFALLAANFGRSGMTYGQGDLNGDGAVNGTDFALLAGNFGGSVPAAPAVQAAAPPVQTGSPPKQSATATAARRRQAVPRAREPRAVRRAVNLTPPAVSWRQHAGGARLS